MRPRRAAAVLLLFLPLCAWAGKAIAPSPDSYVYNEEVVSDAAQARLSASLSAFERRSGHQFAVALFQSLDGEDVDDYSNRVFRAWKIGGRKGNDGLLFALFKNDRRWRVEVGYGLEGTLTDLEASEIARLGVPDFKAGNFDEGVEAVVKALEDKIEGKTVPLARPSSDDDQNVPGTFFILALVVLWIALRMRWAVSPYRMHGGGWGSLGGGGFGGGGGFIGGGGSSGGGGASGGW